MALDRADSRRPRNPDRAAAFVLDDELALRVQRSQAAVAAAIAIRDRAIAAVADAVSAVSAVVARHGDLLGPPVDGAVTGQARLSRIFTDAGVGAVRRLVRNAAREFGLGDEAVSDFVLAVQELMTNAVRHGGGWGRMTLHCAGDVLVCVVTDHGPGFAGDPRRYGGLPPADAEGGRGLWLVQQMTDSLDISSGPAGVKVTVTAARPSPPPQ